VKVPGANTLSAELSGWLSADRLTIYVISAGTGTSAYDVYVATRASATAAFGGATVIAEVSTADADMRATTSGDELSMVIESHPQLPGDLFLATRTTAGSAFGVPSPIAAVNGVGNETSPWISADGLVLYFASDRNNVTADGEQNIFRSTRASAGDAFGAPTQLAELVSPSTEYAPVVSADGLEIFFASTRGAAITAAPDLWRATRASAGAPFDPPARVAELSEAIPAEIPAWLSPDRCELMFASTRAGSMNYDLWMATRPL
jgi:hypothetical protein